MGIGSLVSEKVGVDLDYRDKIDNTTFLLALQKSTKTMVYKIRPIFINDNAPGFTMVN